MTGCTQLYQFMSGTKELKERSVIIHFCDERTNVPRRLGLRGSPEHKIEVRPRYWLAGAARVCELTPALLPDRSALRYTR